MNRSSIFPNRITAGLPLLAVAFVLFSSVPVLAQSTVTITIGGDVYGGGKEGAVGTGNASVTIYQYYSAAEAVTYNAALTGAVNVGDDDGNGGTYTAETAAAYNATLPGAVKEGDVKSVVEPSDVTITDATTAFTQVKVLGGTVRTVFGGGKNGRTYGSTSVVMAQTNDNVPTAIGGTVSNVDWTGTIHGGLFGAGDGASAYVFGNSSVKVEAGTVYQNVYGGGNQATLKGNTLVTLQGGDLKGSVFGGARMADINGFSEVNVDGENLKSDLVVNFVYGGNDISGTIEGKKTVGTDETNSYVHSSVEASGKQIFIGQLFAGGNGDYHNTTSPDVYEAGGGLTMIDIPAIGTTPATTQTFTGLNKPVLEKALIDLQGGTFGYVFGGGNFATITGETNIFLNNTSTVSTTALSGTGGKLTNTRLEAMGLNPTYFHTDKQFNRVFGGNNKADMAIRPTWHLTKGSIWDLFSGGNEGRMTSPTGILLPVESADMTVQNVYGGCRIADVDPDDKQGVGLSIAAETRTVGTTTCTFQADHAARVLITAGNITNVYGGNDVSGTVFGGTDVEIYSSITGDVYGGGNGSYVYSDNNNLDNDVTYDDLIYDIPSGKTSVEALNEFRPQTVAAYIHLVGNSTTRTSVPRVFGGGNSASVSDAIHLQLGEYVTIEDVFLGSNGENMVDNSTLTTYKSGKVGTEDVSTLDFYNATTGSATFATYMLGAAVACMPTYGFDSDYYATSTEAALARIGSFYCGGNVGSMTSTAKFDISFNKPIVLKKKLVGGCNTATVAATENNAEHVGGFIGDALDASGDKISLDVDGIIFDVSPVAADLAAAGAGNQGNVFGGCFESGKVIGNVVISVKKDIIPSNFFASGNPTKESYLDYSVPANAANLFATPLSVFGGGYGEGTTIEGNTTIHISESGAMLKAFGGSYGGSVVGHTHVNLSGTSNVGIIYGGGFQGPVTGSTTVNLDGGTVYNVFGGACNAEIAGYAQVYMGTGAGNGGTTGFTTVTNNVYGGNDFGGTFTESNAETFYARVRTDVQPTVYNPNSQSTPDVTKASAYVEYRQGSAKNIFGGSCGAYDYTASAFSTAVAAAGFSRPYLANAFVNFRANANENNTIEKVFGAGEGNPGTSSAANVQDLMQDRSYVLVDIAAESERFENLNVFGAGANCGVGMRLASAAASAEPEKVSAVVDLVRGHINEAYGASLDEGVTRRTVVNVPTSSTIKLWQVFGGGYGKSNTSPCDTYEAHVNWSSGLAEVGNYKTGVYGGNNQCRRTLFSFVNINAPVYYDIDLEYTAPVYGAGKGEDTWSQYTEVHLYNGAKVYEVYGGGNAGLVLNTSSVAAWKTKTPSIYTVLGGDYDPGTGESDEAKNGLGNALVHENGLGLKCNTNVYIHKGASVCGYMYNQSLSGAYAYGGGYGSTATVSGTTYVGLHGGYVAKDIYGSGSNGSVYDIYGTKDFTAGTNVYIEGGKVRRAYGGGWQGNVGYTELPFVVDETTVDVAATLANDIEGTTNVVVGIPEDEGKTMYPGEYGFFKGVPAVEWSAFGGGEKGGVIGMANLTMYNGYVGYRYLGDDALVKVTGDPVKTDDPATAIDERYAPKLDDETNAGGGIGNLVQHGNLFGSGFDDGSWVDNSTLKFYGGYVRNSIYGGGEIAAVGRGETKESGSSNSVRELKGVWKTGTTNVQIFGGHVQENVFGGGKGFTAVAGAIYAFSERFTNGYVFGQTAVNIYGGEIGTEEGVAEGYGNVFGGGNIGYVYSGNYKHADDGYYYDSASGGHLTEDCKVVVSPHSRVIATEEQTIGGKTVIVEIIPDERISGQSKATVPIDGKSYYSAYVDASGVFHRADFVPIDDLNKLENKTDDKWNNMDTETGVTIHNAVFAGGNVSHGSDMLYAESYTVFGNATASIVDVFCRDLITLGEDEIGGLYGDGNLTFVDGYRELNITNYGTDYYSEMDKITYEKYLTLNDRERAYFSLTYKCITACTIGTTSYNVGDTMNQDVYDRLSDTDKANFKPDEGVCSIYAGRMLNTIQRADFCGVFGSRMVMKGARDRVPKVADYTNYTLNRVGEVSLNRKSIDQTVHGNYFGIYNIVNFLGALTSDIDFQSTLWTKDNSGKWSDTGAGNYYTKKSGMKGKRDRNVAESYNEVALASGVYLELVDHLATAGEPVDADNDVTYSEGDKVYGPVTGVVALNLISASTGEGGGYVYAKNIHGSRSTTSITTVLTLSAPNTNAVTHKSFTYSSATADDWMETSGNFVSADRKIIDECFPASNHYQGTDISPAHYWFIRGEFYVYDQLISAYTGSATPFIENMNIPLNITALGNGKLVIENIQTNLYANGEAFPLKAGSTTEHEEKVICNGITYRPNDPISYWDYYNLSSVEKTYFTTETYACVKDVYASKQDAQNGIVAHQAGEMMLEADYNTLVAQTWYSEKGEVIEGTEAFRITNAMSHDNGFALSVAIDNPLEWGDWYSKTSAIEKHLGPDTDYPELGPTYNLPATLGSSYVFGQREYGLGDLVDKTVIDNYSQLSSTAKSNINTTLYPQALFSEAYMAKEACEIVVGGTTAHIVERGAIPVGDYNQLSAAEQANFVKAYIATETIKLTDLLIISKGRLYSLEELNDYNTSYPQLVPKNGEEFVTFKDAYYCTGAGFYGGTEFAAGQNYQASKWSVLKPGERNLFKFNYDALDVMIDPDYPGDISLYDGQYATSSPVYSTAQYVDFDVVYNGDDPTTIYAYDGTPQSVSKGNQLTREDYKELINEPRHYSKVSVNFSGKSSDVIYVVKEDFGQQGRVFTTGMTIDAADYGKMDPYDQNKYIQPLTITKTAETGEGGYTKFTYYLGNDQTNTREVVGSSTGDEQNFFLCNEAYTISGTGAKTVTMGTLISDADFKKPAGTPGALLNYQKNFEVVVGVPQEKSTLYVSRDRDIFDFSQDRIFTVIYRYTYSEEKVDDNGEPNGEFETVGERHILNIRVHFKSGEPIIGELLAPPVLLPGSTVGLVTPDVEEDPSFAVLGGGWEIYEDETNALAHKNGVSYTNYYTPMYWYQDGWYVAYYAETYLGRTYSNPVPFTVANYHRMADVMTSKHNVTTTTGEGESAVTTTTSVNDYMYLNDAPRYNKRNPKVYINSADELDNFAAFFELSKNGGEGFDKIAKGENIDFIIDHNINHATTWTSIGDATYCFEGTLHGDGYTISGLDHSLFNNLCGKVYNLGVTGSFAGSGIAEVGGEAENCWVKTSSSDDLSAMKAVMGTGNVINCYYPETNAYATSSLATKRPLSSFYNGEVAYDLNGFYLKKRYADNLSSPGSHEYGFFEIADNANNKLKATLSKGYYTDAAPGYVESRYIDGDFIYAGGIIPATQNERLYSVEDESNSDTYNNQYYPIWPDDYIYFGQALTYGYKTPAYQDMPSHINKSDRAASGEKPAASLWLVSGNQSNRVYRAPAYFRNSTMSVAHFNAYAVLPATSTAATGSNPVYPGLTAIDFTGYNDGNFVEGWSDGIFNKKALDFEGLTGFRSDGQTQNLLAYAAAPADEAFTNKTYDLLNAYFKDIPYAETNADYHTVDIVPEQSVVTGDVVTTQGYGDVRGHVVQKTGDTYTAQLDHFLVDKQDFNAPITYTYATDKRMWYQRKPMHYAQNLSTATPDNHDAWETIVLPFTAKLVTTQTKGEITHFYGIADDAHIGHEYWLREFSGGVKDTGSDNYFANFDRIKDGDNANPNHTVTNTFLWDYYYSEESQKDENKDTYQTYYNESRSYTGYRYLTAGTPYIVAFPGSRYYEFDMSGTFLPQNTDTHTWSTLPAQTVTYALEEGGEISVTDNLASVMSSTKTINSKSCTYSGTFLNTEAATGYYTINDEGTTFEQVSTAAAKVPFRAYFDVTTSSSPAPRRIIIGNGDKDEEPEVPMADILTRGLKIYGQKDAIVIESTLDYETTVVITTVSGKLIGRFTVKPQGSEVVPVNSRGVYIANRQKVAVL